MISAIVAISKNGVIGNDGDLPWSHIKEDMKWFVNKTTDNVVVMGRKTWDSIPADKRPLKNRINIVVTSKPLTAVKGAKGTLNGELTAGLHAHQNAYPDKEVFVIGGKEIYEQCFPACETIYVTKIKKKYDGDTKLDLKSVLKDFKLDETIKTKECIFETWKRKS